MVLLVLLVNFLSGFTLEFLYISLRENTRSIDIEVAITSPDVTVSQDLSKVRVMSVGSIERLSI